MNGRVFDDLRDGLAEAAAIARGEADPTTFREHLRPTLDVRTIRAATGLTQKRFAEQFGISLGALRDWEQGRSQPDRTARTLLMIIEREPAAVERVLSAA